MGTKIFYLRDLSLLLSTVFYCNSTILILERYLHYYASVLISTLSITSLCHSAFHRLKLGKIFESRYWSTFFVTSAYLVTTDDSTHWNSWRARVLLTVGLSFLSVYCIVLGVLSYLRPSEEKQEEVNPEMARAPLLVEISFVFIGNGFAMVGRGLISEERLEAAIAGSAVMLGIALLFFYCFVHCSIKIESEIHPHTE